jgi:type VI protein secretion system component VasF
MTQPEVQQEIEQIRERLSQTVEELAAKAAELKAKAQDQAAGLSRQASQSQTVRRDWPLALVAAGIVAVGAALAWRRRTT